MIRFWQIRDSIFGMTFFLKMRNKSSFFKQAKVYPVFPYKEEKLKWDDYGEIITLEEI